MKIFRDYLDKSPLSEVLIKKFGILGLILFSGYCVYANHGYLKRVEDTLRMNNIMVEEKFFPDPSGLCTETSINDKGKKEVYLLHKESGKKKAVMYDMGAKTESLLDFIDHRIPNMDRKESIYTLERILDMEKELYQKISFPL